MTTASLRASVIAGCLLVGAPAAAQTPSVEELSRRVAQLEERTYNLKADLDRSLIANKPAPSPLEWIVFGVVAIAFAVAWARINRLREETRRREFESLRDERIADESMQQTKALLALVRDFKPKSDDARGTADLLGMLLRISADYVARRATGR